METLQIYDKEAGMRLDRFLKKRYPKLPIGLVFKLIRKRKRMLKLALRHYVKCWVVMISKPFHRNQLSYRKQ